MNIDVLTYQWQDYASNSYSKHKSVKDQLVLVSWIYANEIPKSHET